MDTFNLYEDVATRTDGDIYLGVVGPVRTGKSTFIKRFMELLVLPNIQDKNKQKRAMDEMPQSADGKTVMTTQPKFVPAEAVDIRIGEKMDARVRLIDCVGYMVDGAMGGTEDGKTRMVKTPWFAEAIPFEKAAEIGTQKVISEHSTIGIVITCDGSVTDISRSKYVDAEQRAVTELKSIGKPFAVVLNTKTPEDVDTKKLQEALRERYGVPVLAKDVLNMTERDAYEILESILMEFPVKMLDAQIPSWIQALPSTDPVVAHILSGLEKMTEKIKKMSDVKSDVKVFADSPFVTKCDLVSLDMGRGRIVLEMAVKPELFYNVLSDYSGKTIDDDFTLMAYVRELTGAAESYNKIKNALDEVAIRGYGVVPPSMGEMVLEEPEIVKQSGRFGVRLRASAPALHIMKVDVTTEVNPIVGSEAQSEELVKYLLSEFETDPQGIWQTNMFGKSLESLVNEGLNNKLTAVPDEAHLKMRKTLGRIINEGKGGMICILL